MSSLLKDHFTLIYSEKMTPQSSPVSRVYVSDGSTLILAQKELKSATLKKLRLCLRFAFIQSIKCSHLMDSNNAVKHWQLFEATLQCGHVTENSEI